MKKKVLIIDDSALMRRVISDIINSDNRFIIEAIAGNGLEALELLLEGSHKFDVILLDINMPKMNGIEFLEEINKRDINIKVIIVSTVAKEGAKETIRALELGAFDFVSKPDSFMETKNKRFKDHIINGLLCAVGLENESLNSEVKASVEKKAIMKNKGKSNTNRKKLVALACSTGGPKALQIVLPLLPANLDAPVLIVQHMPEGFTNSLAMRLDELSKIHVKEAEDNEIVEKGTVYIAKGGFQMRLRQQKDGTCRLLITQEPSRQGLKPCADILYESLVDSDFNEVTCVILTGMGGDGTRGITQLEKNKNIYVIAQNAETSTVYGMPKVIAESGLVNEVVPLDKVASAIIKNVGVE